MRFKWSLRVKQKTREDIEGNVFHLNKKNHFERIFLTASHSRTCGLTSWRWINCSKQRKYYCDATHYVKLGQKRRESSKRNYYTISPRVIIKAIIIIMLSHVRRARFLVITLSAVENKRSGAAEVAGIASIRLANTPNQGKRCTAPRRHSSRGFLSLGKGKVRVFHILISLSTICA